jgi:hypothetical protein
MKLCGTQTIPNEKGESTADLDKSSECSICLGVWSDEFSSELTKALQDAIQPYGDPSSNKFSFQVTPPIIILPGDLAYRFHVASQTAAFKTLCTTTAAVFGSDLKEYAKRFSRTIEGAGRTRYTTSTHIYVKEESRGHLAVQIFSIL